jgi:hypothetical protein
MNNEELEKLLYKLKIRVLILSDFVEATKQFMECDDYFAKIYWDRLKEARKQFDDRLDLLNAGEAMEEEGTIPWETVKKNLHL